LRKGPKREKSSHLSQKGGGKASSGMGKRGLKRRGRVFSFSLLQEKKEMPWIQVEKGGGLYALSRRGKEKKARCLARGGKKMKHRPCFLFVFRGKREIASSLKKKNVTLDFCCTEKNSVLHYGEKEEKGGKRLIPREKGGRLGKGKRRDLLSYFLEKRE